MRHLLAFLFLLVLSTHAFAQQGTTGAFESVTDTVIGLNFAQSFVPVLGICKPTSSLRQNTPSASWSATLVADGTPVIAITNSDPECMGATLPAELSGDTMGTATLAEIDGTPPLPLFIVLSQNGVLKPVRVRAQLAFDDGSQVAGAFVINQPPGMLSLSTPIVNGGIDYTLLLDPTSSYSGLLDVWNTDVNDVQFPLWQVPLSGPLNIAAMNYINGHVFNITLRKADGTIAGMTVQ